MKAKTMSALAGPHTVLKKHAMLIKNRAPGGKRDLESVAPKGPDNVVPEGVDFDEELE